MKMKPSQSSLCDASSLREGALSRAGQLPARTDRIVYHKELLHFIVQQLFSFYSSFASR